MSRKEATLPFHRRCCHGCERGYPVAVGGSTALAAVPSKSAAMAAGLLAAVVGVLRPPEPPPELLATSVVAGKVAIDPPEFLAAAGAVAAAGSKSQLLRVVISLGAEVAVVGDPGLRKEVPVTRLGYGIAF
ncbi:uncharacterized protein DS421_2g54920 [Arachis hypogaea]|nr:uncharacterized protein DS421_2g54920 [Arachis hypogaea]